MLNWVKTQTGIVIAILIGILAIFLLFKGQSIWDNYLGKRYEKKIISADAHADSSKVDLANADTAHAEGIILRSNYGTLTKSRRVRESPIAVEVKNAADAVIAKGDKEVVDLRSANTQLQRESHDLRTSGQARIPRLIPYVDIFERTRIDSTGTGTRKGSIGIRAGLDYRVINHFNAMVELSREPEYVARAGLHITFR